MWRLLNAIAESHYRNSHLRYETIILFEETNINAIVLIILQMRIGESDKWISGAKQEASVLIKRDFLQ